METIQQQAHWLIPTVSATAILALVRFTLRPFFWRICSVVVPLALFGIVVLDAWLHYGDRQHPGFRFNLGVDLAGGTILVYEVDRDWWAAQSEQDKASFSAEKLAQILKRRVDPANLLEVTIRPIQSDPPRVEIILPVRSARGGVQDVADIERVKSKISQVGKLEFRLLADSRDENGEAVFEEAKNAVQGFVLDAKNIPPPPSDEHAWVELSPAAAQEAGFSEQTPVGFQRAGTIAFYHGEYEETDARTGKSSRQVRHFVLTRIPPADALVTGEDLANVGEQPDPGTGRPEVVFSLKPDGADRFYQLTNAVGHYLAIILDSKVMSYPVLQARLRESGRITMGSQERGPSLKRKVEELVLILRTGALPATLSKEPVSTESMGPTLGEDTIRKGTLSVVLAFWAIVIFMLVYYRWAGMIACLALLANLLLTVGFMVAVKAVFTLPGLAGLVLTLGMAVDANVLIYERIREERERGASLLLAIRNGYERAFPTIIDTHLTSIFTAIVLYVVGNDQLKGFGVSLTVGLLTSLFTALYMTRIIFDILVAKKWIGELRMLRLFRKPNIDFMAVRHYWFTATVVLSVLGVLVFALRGERGLSIEFTGGTSYKIEFREPQAIETVRAEVSRAVFPMATVTLQQAIRSDDLDRLLRESPEVRQLPSYFVSLETEGVGTVAGVRQVDRFRLYTTEADRAKLREMLISVLPAQGATVTVGDAALPDPAVYTLYRAGSGFRKAEGSVEGPYPGYAEGGPLTPDFMIRTTLKDRNLVRWMVSQVFGDRLVWSEATASPVRQIPGERLDQEFTLTLTNSTATAETVGRLVAEWMRERGVLLPDQYYQVDEVQAEAGAAATGDGGLVQLRVRFVAPEGTRPEELPAFLTARDGPLYQPKSDGVQNVDSTLAGETQSKALVAILLSWAAICGYLWFRFGNWTFGLAAVLCLIHDLCFTIGLISLAHYLVVYTPVGAWLLLDDFKMDMPAVAALLTLVGFSVNDTIVVFDRIREVRGKSPELTPQIINESVNQTLSRTVLTSLTVFMVVIVLYIFGGEGIHLFSYVMVVGVVVGTYSSIFVASPLLLIFGEGKVREAASARQLQPASS
jgi:SecD/SecF fusion protein